MPNDPGHSPTLNGTCSPVAGAVVCLSGVCDGDNRCGYADFDGPCNQANESVVCRSGDCSTNGLVCVPAGGCAVDADCSSSQWCKRSAGACMAKVANGGAIPNDPGHSSPFDAASQKLIGKAICPACLDAAHQGTLADRVVDEAESETRDVYCSGTIPLP